MLQQLLIFFSGYLWKSLSLFIQAYQLNCPSISQWRIRGNRQCNISLMYTCLLNTNDNVFSENCEFSLNLLEPGNYIYKTLIL